VDDRGIAVGIARFFITESTDVLDEDASDSYMDTSEGNPGDVDGNMLSQLGEDY
jgi:hypothetical protein